MEEGGGQEVTSTCKNISLGLSSSRGKYLWGFPKLFSAAPQIVNASKFPFFAKHIREREQAALPMETGVEASLDHYGLCRARLSFGQETIAAVNHLLKERQGVTMGLFRVRA